MGRKNKKGGKGGRGFPLQWYSYKIPSINQYLDIHHKHEGLEATIDGIVKFMKKNHIETIPLDVIERAGLKIK